MSTSQDAHDLVTRAAAARHQPGRFGRRTLLRGAVGIGAGAVTATLLQPGAASPVDLLTPRAAAAAGNEKVFLFYRATDGAAAVGTIGGGSFSTIGGWGPGSFGKTWTHIVGCPLNGGELLFYSQQSLTLVRARLLWTTFQQVEDFGGQPFWSNVTATPRNTRVSRYLFSHTFQGSAAWGYAPRPHQDYPEGSLGAWTHVVAVPYGVRNGYSVTHQLLFYNTFTGAGAIDLDPTTTVYAPGAFATNWSHVVATGNASTQRHDILFYNRASRAFALARLTPDGRGLVTIQLGTFGDWTHIVAAGADGFLFYNQNNGNGAIGRVQGNQFVTTRYYPGAFATGWTHIADVDQAIG